MDDAEHRAVVTDYGPVGRTVARMLDEGGIAPTIVELNLNTVRRLRAESIPMVHGDATRRDILVEAGVAGRSRLSSAPRACAGARRSSGSHGS